MKTTSTFNLSKSAKRMLALMPRDKRGHWKKMLIESEESERIAKLVKLKVPKED